MGIRGSLPEPGALILAALFGGVAGAVAFVRAPSPWWSAPVTVGVAGILLVVHLLTASGVGRATRARAARLRRWTTVHVTDILSAVAGVGCGWLATALTHRVPVGLSVGTAVFATALAADRFAERLRRRRSRPPALLRPAPVQAPPVPPASPKSVGVVFVHGLFSSPAVWAKLQKLIAADDDLADVAMLNFQYASPIVKINPLRRIPTFANIADGLATYLKLMAGTYPALVLVSHSQGGLIVQQYLAQSVEAGRAERLDRIRRVVLFACPNSGSEFAQTLRRLAWFWRHPQERDLRPFKDSIAHAHRVVLNRVIHARESHVPVSVYVGMEDNVVKPASAAGAFPDTDTLPGDHFTIVAPDTGQHPSYLAIRKDLLDVLREAAPDRAPGPGR